MITESFMRQMLPLEFAGPSGWRSFFALFR
jgi:hypothetical protein